MDRIRRSYSREPECSVIIIRPCCSSHLTPQNLPNGHDAQYRLLGTFRTSGHVRFESAKRRIVDIGQSALEDLDL